MIPELFTRKFDIDATHDQDPVILDPSNGQRLGMVFERIAKAQPRGGMYLDNRGRDGKKRSGRIC